MIRQSDQQHLTTYSIPSGDLPPDEMVIKIKNYESLSREAKSIIHIILNAPNEILSVIPSNRSKSKKLTQNKIKIYLTLEWQKAFFSKAISGRIANSIIYEIKEWVKTL